MIEKIKKDAGIGEKAGGYFYVAGFMFMMEFLSVLPLKFAGNVSQSFLSIYGFAIMMVIYFIGGVLYSRKFEEISIQDVGIILFVRLFRKISNLDVSLIFILARVVVIFVIGAKAGYMFKKEKVAN